MKRKPRVGNSSRTSDVKTPLRRNETHLTIDPNIDFNPIIRRTHDPFQLFWVIQK